MTHATANPNPCPSAPPPAAGSPLLRPTNPDITLLQSLTDDPCAKLSASSGVQIFFDYFNLMWPWVVGIAAGISVGYALAGGMQIMLSGSNQGWQTAGKERIQWAIVGLALIGLAGVILETLNPLFFVQT